MYIYTVLATPLYMYISYIHVYYLIGWVAVQYCWILDESVLYLGEFVGRAKYKQDESNVQRYWLATPFNENLLFIIHTTHDSKWPVHQAIHYHWILDGFP